MLYVSAVVKTGQIADQANSSDRTPAHILDQSVINPGFRGDHHFSASELAVIEGEEETSAAIKFALALRAHRKWTAVEPGQGQENRGEVAQLSPVAEATRTQSRHICREADTEQIHVMNHTSAVTQAHDVTSAAPLRDYRFNCVLDTAIAEVPQKRVPRAQGQKCQGWALSPRCFGKKSIDHF